MSLSSVIQSNEKIESGKQQAKEQKKADVKKEIKAMAVNKHTDEDTAENKVEPEKSDSWEYSITEDKMRGTKKAYASLVSTNKVQLGFPYNDSVLAVSLRKDEGETNVMLTVKGQFVCNKYSEKCYVSAKFDDNPVVDFEFGEAAHGTPDVIFIEKEKEFIAEIKKSKKAIIEVPLFNNGRAQYEFDTKGLEWDE